MMYYKGIITTIEQLPEMAQVGDTYYCDREGLIYTLIGKPPEWVPVEGFLEPVDKLLKILEVLNEDNGEYILKEEIRKIIG